MKKCNLYINMEDFLVDNRGILKTDFHMDIVISQETVIKLDAQNGGGLEKDVYLLSQ